MVKRLLYATCTILAIFMAVTPVKGANDQTDSKSVVSPDGRLDVKLTLTPEGFLKYCVAYDGKTMIEPSMLGLKTDMGDYTRGLMYVSDKESLIDTTYVMRGTKKSGNHYTARRLELTLKTEKSKRDMTVIVQVSNNDVAYRYHFAGAKTISKDEPRRVTILSEAGSYRFPEGTTTFLSPQIDGDHKGWMSTKPSYEEEYKADAAMNVPSKYGKGYTFPCLFHVGGATNLDMAAKNKKDDGWVLLSETGVNSSYCASHISDYTPEEGYVIAFPDMTENHGIGCTTPAMSLPGSTPWRTITVGNTLKPIVETTIPYDVVDEQYKAREEYRPGRYTWSWLIWQDNSANYDDQVQFINTASEMGFEYCLVDGFWDVQTGKARMEELSKYAQSKGVHLMLWYNSNGAANDAPQGPRNCMNTAIAREKEMAWMESIGIKGIKVDFFGGDKQQTIQLYEDILSDANRHGIQVIFHGCTLPRGWEKMYPNFVASEAVLASENVYFNEHHAKQEGFELTMHPFCRNAVASMDWGGCLMNHYMNKEDKPGRRHRRYTSDTFEMAAGIINQTSINCVDIQPSNLTDRPSIVLDYLRELPTTWEETQYIDGYPTKDVILARKSTNGEWIVAGLNGENKAKTVTITLPMFAGQTVSYYTDQPAKKTEVFPTPVLKDLKVDKNGKAKVTMQGMGGLILKTKKI